MCYVSISWLFNKQNPIASHTRIICSHLLSLVSRLLTFEIIVLGYSCVHFVLQGLSVCLVYGSFFYFRVFSRLCASLVITLSRHPSFRSEKSNPILIACIRNCQWYVECMHTKVAVLYVDCMHTVLVRHLLQYFSKEILIFDKISFINMLTYLGYFLLFKLLHSLAQVNNQCQGKSTQRLSLPCSSNGHYVSQVWSFKQLAALISIIEDLIQLFCFV